MSNEKMCKRGFVVVVLGLAMGLSLASCAVSDGESAVDEAVSEVDFTGVTVYDAGTVCWVNGERMHCCPSGFAMIGAHLDRNTFKCAQLSFAFGVPGLDRASQRNNMHVCPPGEVMVGLNTEKNLLACQGTLPQLTFEYVDGSTKDGFPMHVCPSGFAMAGIHVGDNKFTCAF